MAASLDETLNMVKQPPPGPGLQAKGGPQAKDLTGGVKVDKKGDGAGKDANREEKPLPKEIVAQYPDADLSKVKVVYNSPEAAKKGVQGFAQGDCISLAPGLTDPNKVLRHEAAHIVQQKTGKATGKADSPAKSEEKANAAEHKDMAAKDLGASPPGKAQNKGNETNANDSGMPALSFDGFKFEKAEGSFNKTLAESDWDEKDLFKAEQWWRFPAFPAGGLYVKASGTFKPEAKMVAKGTYTYNAKDKAFEVKGALEGSLKAAITFAVEGGAGINLVIQKGGVGLEAAATLEAGATLSRSLGIKISEKGVAFTLTPFEFDLSATLKAALSLVLWTEGWFYDDKWKWTFAEWNIASLTGYKACIEVGGGAGEKVSGAFKSVKPGTFKWGSPPEATESSGKKI